MNYASLKAAIQAVIKQNGNEEITGDLLQQSLLAMINALGVGYQFVGVATPATNPTIGDEKIMYIAVDSGTYSNFVTPAVTLDGSQIAIFLYSTSWSAILLNVPNGAYIATELAKKVDKVAGKGLSTNDFTDVLKARLENSLVTSDIVQSLGDDETKVISQAAMTAILLNYARIDGYYSSLIAGAAENLVGRGSVPALFTFRTTGGSADVGSGTAQIKKLYGNSIVWNQLVGNKLQNWSASGFTVTTSSEKVTFTGQEGATTGILRQLSLNMPIVEGHKYLIRVNSKSPTSVITAMTVYDSGFNSYLSTGNRLDFQNGFALILTASRTGTADRITFSLASGQTIEDIVIEIFGCNIIDLTLEFGLGNEPATVAEFETLYWLKYYGYNAGQIKNNGAVAIKTVGRNLFNPTTGKAKLPGATGVADLTNGINCYQIIGPYTSITDENGNAITPNAGGFFSVDSKQEITVVGGTSETCIALTWSGYRNGEYEQYTENTMVLNIKEITGIPAGGSVSETIFPDGMRSAGDARDALIVDADGWCRKAVRNVAGVNIGNLDWAFTSITGFSGFILTASLMNAKIGFSGICGKYPFRGSYSLVNDKESGYIYNYCLCIKDSSYSQDNDGAAALKSDLSGVMLNYELATPVEYTLDTPIFMGYPANDFGTEERLPADTENAVQAPILYDVQYPMNAVDMLRRLGVNYIKKESMDHILQAFVNAGIIGSYTLTYNATNDDYDCVVEPVEP